MPIDYKKYPPNWKSEIRPRILKRAKHHCELCGIRNYATATGVKGQAYRTVLTIAHLDHNIKNNDPENLKALCQPCHLRYDAKEKARKRKENTNQQQFKFDE